MVKHNLLQESQPGILATEMTKTVVKITKLELVLQCSVLSSKCAFLLAVQNDIVMAAITKLLIVYGQDANPPNGYNMIRADLNSGAGGEYLYLCYTTEPSAGPPITAIQVTCTSDPSISGYVPTGYTKVAGDLNKGAGGKYIYVCYVTGTSPGPVTGVDVLRSDSPNVWPQKDWYRINQDCNEGAWGKYIYITYKY